MYEAELTQAELRRINKLQASRDKLVEAIKYALGCGIMTETVCKKFKQALAEAEKIGE